MEGFQFLVPYVTHSISVSEAMAHSCRFGRPRQSSGVGAFVSLSMSSSTVADWSQMIIYYWQTPARTEIEEIQSLQDFNATYLLEGPPEPDGSVDRQQAQRLSLLNTEFACTAGRDCVLFGLCVRS